MSKPHAIFNLMATAFTFCALGADAWGATSKAQVRDSFRSSRDYLCSFFAVIIFSFYMK